MICTPRSGRVPRAVRTRREVQWATWQTDRSWPRQRAVPLPIVTARHVGIEKGLL